MGLSFPPQCHLLLDCTLYNCGKHRTKKSTIEAGFLELCSQRNQETVNHPGGRPSIPTQPAPDVPLTDGCRTATLPEDRAVGQCPQAIISLIQGPACGGGFSLALASDIRIAAESAKMNAAYIKAGLTACDMACSYLLPRLVGLSVASELMMTGRFINAERALRVNLVSEVMAEAELEASADSLIGELLATSPMGLRLTKDGLNMSVDAGSLEAAMALEDRQQSLVAMTRDAGEAVTAFLEKRKPVWQDR